MRTRTSPRRFFGRSGTCVEIKIVRRVRAESSRRPPRHRCDACSMAWRCRFLAARRDQRGRVIAIPDTLVDFHTDRRRRCFLRQLRRHRRRASSLPSSSLGRLRPYLSSWPWLLRLPRPSRFFAANRKRGGELRRVRPVRCRRYGFVSCPLQNKVQRRSEVECAP